MLLPALLFCTLTSRAISGKWIIDTRLCSIRVGGGAVMPKCFIQSEHVAGSLGNNTVLSANKYCLRAERHPDRRQQQLFFTVKVISLYLSAAPTSAGAEFDRFSTRKLFRLSKRPQKHKQQRQRASYLGRRSSTCITLFPALNSAVCYLRCGAGAVSTARDTLRRGRLELALFLHGSPTVRNRSFWACFKYTQ